MKDRKKFFLNCHLAGRAYHDADEVWDELNVGTLVHLVYDDDNKYDPNAVAVQYIREGETEPYTIGYLPRSENSSIAAILSMGWTDIFECRICQKDPEQHPEEQIRLSIRVKRNE